MNIEPLHATPRERFDYLQQHTPTFAHNLITGVAHDLNAHGRKPSPGHRSDVTPSVLADRFPDLLTGGLGLAFQLRAYRRIAALKTQARGPWRLACLDLLGDLAQHLDPKLQRDRAERIARDAIADALPLLINWLDQESR